MIELPRSYVRVQPHGGQRDYLLSTSRFNIAHPGRRGGKSMVAKKRKIRAALNDFNDRDDPLVIFAAPTFAQAKAIYWRDLKKMTEPMQAAKPNETELCIELVNGARLQVVGMDRPERIEGQPIDDGVLDEYGNMKPEVWSEHLRPALDTLGRPGRLDFIGVPEGRNHYYDLVRAAQADTSGAWSVHHWPSWEVLPAEFIEAAKRDLDPLVFAQEYGGEFVSFLGQAYYAFTESNIRTGLRDAYDDTATLIVTFDFNRTPGTAAVLQEHAIGTCVIGEVFIERNSTTPQVCANLLADWGEHKGNVVVYGDASGGNKTAAAVQGSDWDLIDARFQPHFGTRYRKSLHKRNPSERQRINAVNSRLCDANNTRRLFVDQVHAPKCIRDFEGVRTKRDGSGEIDKTADRLLTHLSDGIGYYIEREFPTGDRYSARITQLA
jgi:hypothetical protein